MRVLSPLDLSLVVAFVVYCIGSGFRARRAASQDLEQFFLAGRSLPGWKAGLSMAATQFAADTPLLVAGLLATGGLFALWRLWIYALAFLLMGLMLGPAWRRAGVLTDAELAELRYGGRLSLVLRVAKAVYFGTVFNCAVIAMVLYAAARIAEPLLPWAGWLGTARLAAVGEPLATAGLQLGPDAAATGAGFLSLLAVVAVTTLYSTTGGLRAVVNTDLTQFVVAMLATLAYAGFVVHRAGGLDAIPGRLGALYGATFARQTLAVTPDQARDAGLLVLATIAVQWIAQMNADGTGYLAQRTMACRSDADARQAALVFVVAQILLRSLLWIPIGLGLLVLFPFEPGSAGAGFTAAREDTFVAGIAELPSGVRGLMVVGMLAALASTLDTHLNWGASYWSNDLYRRLVCQAWLRREPSDRELVWVARLSGLVIVGLALVVLVRVRSIQSAWQTTLLLGAGMGVPLVLRWIWWRMNAGAELLAIVASSLAAPWLLGTALPEGGRLLVMAALTAAVSVIVAVAGSRTPSPAALTFYERVRPPGFWAPVAVRCGDEPARPLRRLAEGLWLTAATALAVFCLLVAACTWLFESPPPAWCPWRGPWIAACLGLAGVLAAALRRGLPPVLARSVRAEQPPGR